MISLAHELAHELFMSEHYTLTLRKLCYIESTIVPSYNSITGAILEYDINQA